MAKKLIFPILLLVLFLFSYSGAYAETTFEIKNLPDDSYNLKLFIQNKNQGEVNNLFQNQKLSELQIIYSLRQNIYNSDTKQINSAIIDSTWEWENPSYIIKNGTQEVVLLFHLKDDMTIKATIVITLKNEQERAVLDVEPQTTTTLTSNTLLLQPNTRYDINLLDKVADETTTYNWRSNNIKIATVNKNGVVTAKSKGNAKITCYIITGSDSYKLTSDVVVGETNDDTSLSDSELDLEIGDKYTIYAENTVSKSKIKWTTSDKSVITVKSSSGKITAIGKGKAFVYCTISTNKTVVVLKCDINVD